jgi:hypothetical protein
MLARFIIDLQRLHVSPENPSGPSSEEAPGKLSTRPRPQRPQSNADSLQRPRHLVARNTSHSSAICDVRFGSLADIAACRCDVRFTPKSGHSRVRLEYPLSAIADITVIRSSWRRALSILKLDINALYAISRRQRALVCQSRESSKVIHKKVIDTQKYRSRIVAGTLPGHSRCGRSLRY